MKPDGNIFDDAQAPASGERFEVLCRTGPVRVERILSSATPGPGVYVQGQDEWVLLARGPEDVREPLAKDLGPQRGDDAS